MDNRTLLEDVRDALKPFAERAGVEYVLGRDETPAPDTHVIGNELMLQILDLRRARDALSRVEAALAEKKENTPMTDEQIKHMVDRFLQWKLPEDFRPDGGIEFDPISSKGTAYERRREPVGTNLLSATQAEAMVRHMLDGLPALAETSEERVERVARAICKATYYDVEPDMYESEEAFFTKDGPDAWKHFGDSDFMHQARAAIAAMGE